MRNSEYGARQQLRGTRGERGIALITVLLVTALLMALIFEFAYGTRVSLRAAVNFRDSQRAYFLARSGVSAFGRIKELQDMIPQGEWYPPPVMLEPDTELMLRWEDEAGKIKVTDVKTNTIRQIFLGSLFENQGIDRKVLSEMMDINSPIHKLTLLTGLHQFMSDEDYDKVAPYLTVNPNVDKININTASEQVLLALGISSATFELIKEERERTPINDLANNANVNNLMVTGTTSKVINFMTTTSTSDVLSVSSRAVVGGYTKQIDAIITRATTTGGSATGYTINYWRVL